MKGIYVYSIATGNYSMYCIENKMLDNTLSPPAVIRRLKFPSPKKESKATHK